MVIFRDKTCLKFHLQKSLEIFEKKSADMPDSVNPIPTTQGQNQPL